MKKNDLIITIIFIMLLIGPSICYFVLDDYLDHKNYENRNLYEKPNLKLSKLTKFSKEYENYYNDHIPFKNEIRSTYSKFLYTKLNMSFSEKVILGKDGWLFYNSINDGTSMSDYQKTINFSKEEKELIKENLVDTAKKLNDKGSELIIFIAPNKEIVYSEYMKETIPVNETMPYNLTLDLINYLNNTTDLKIVYPKDELIENKKIENTYFKYDTHWNNYGAYIGTMELMKKIDSNFLVSNEISIQKENASGDLAHMIALPDKFISQEPVVNNFYTDIESTCTFDNQLAYCSSNKPLYEKTLLMVGDSFRESMIQYLSKIYKNSVFIHRDIYNTEYLEKYHPDIVVLEFVERYSTLVLNSNLLLRQK